MNLEQIKKLVRVAERRSEQRLSTCVLRNHIGKTGGGCSVAYFMTCLKDLLLASDNRERLMQALHDLLDSEQTLLHAEILEIQAQLGITDDAEGDTNDTQ